MNPQTQSNGAIDRILIAFTTSLALLLSGPAIGQSPPSWPQFHGPGRDNLSTETGLLKEWPDDGPRLIWTATKLGFGYSSVAIADGAIYTAGNMDGRTVISALDMEGQQRWQVENGAAWEGSYPGTRGTPTIDGDRLYHENPLGDVVCLDTKAGTKVWGRNIIEEFGSKNIRWALSESLLIDGDRVVCCPGGPEVSLVALDKMTGKTIWQAKSTGDLASYASPILVEQDGLRMIVTLTLRAIIGVNADDGKLLWRTGHRTWFDENVLRPLYRDGCVFVSGLAAGSVKWKIRVDGQQATLEELWKSKQLDNQHGGVVLVDGYLYGSSSLFNRGKWVCLDWETGERKYAEKGVGKGSLTYADGMLYTLSERYHVGLVEATPEAHRIVSQFRLPEGGTGRSWAHPVVCGGRLFIRHADHLFAFDVSAPK